MKMHVERSIHIKKSPQDIYNIIADFNQWNVWSPWIHCEPTAKTVITGLPQQLGQSQTWTGDVIGSGKQTIKFLDKNKIVEIDLEFVTPFKSQALVKFSFETKDDGCLVTWSMDSQLPFFMFFFKNMMTAFMNSDFDRGLRMLKEFAETGKVVSKSIYQGEKNRPGFQVVGKRNTCKIAEISKVMPEDFQSLDIHRSLLPQPTGAVCMYHKFDVPKGICEYTAGIVFPSERELQPPTGLQLSKFPEHKALVVDHFGPYRNLGNPWGMLMSYQRGKKKKLIKNFPMYEMYMTMPDGRPESEIHTQLIAPIKN